MQLVYLLKSTKKKNFIIKKHMGNTCTHFSTTYKGVSWFKGILNTSGDCGIRNAFILASVATSLSSVVTTVSCVYINESLNEDQHLGDASRKFLVALVTLCVGMVWSFFIFWALYSLFGYGKAMVHMDLR